MEDNESMLYVVALLAIVAVVALVVLIVNGTGKTTVVQSEQLDDTLEDLAGQATFEGTHNCLVLCNKYWPADEDKIRCKSNCLKT